MFASPLHRKSESHLPVFVNRNSSVVGRQLSVVSPLSATPQRSRSAGKNDYYEAKGLSVSKRRTFRSSTVGEKKKASQVKSMFRSSPSRTHRSSSVAFVALWLVSRPLCHPHPPACLRRHSTAAFLHRFFIDERTLCCASLGCACACACVSMHLCTSAPLRLCTSAPTYVPTCRPPIFLTHLTLPRLIHQPASQPTTFPFPFPLTRASQPRFCLLTRPLAR
ncbi:hypothetical protein IWX90DRAFT_300770 [Phyllosticta citrichinensis]|uniref:Uncharacterized protein n=1 Tax=Phyllosticta citrichinensis TaxID=1130410 RepID=A0ABR1XKU4_9PEZI